EEQGDVEKQGNEKEQGNANTTTEEPETVVLEDAATDQHITSPTPLTPPPKQPQDEALDACAALARRVEHLEQDKDASNQGRVIDRDEDVVKETDEVREYTSDTQVEGRRADIYNIDMDHATKTIIAAAIPTVIAPPVKVAALVKAAVPSPRQKRGVVIWDPEEESSTKTHTETSSKDKGKGILVEEPKPMKKKQQV
nr:hypothetical protein [Tanacetum cinerariifolium]